MATLKQFLGKKIIYDKMGQMIFAVQNNGHHQLIADVRGWGAIQNLFKNKDGSINFEPAGKFQDELGNFIANTLNEKLSQL